MAKRYIHYFGNESSENLLEAYGIVKDGKKSDTLNSKICPNCGEQNAPDNSKFCAKCRMVLTYDAYSEALEHQKENEDDLTSIKQQIQTLISIFGSLGEEEKQEIAKQLIERGIYKQKMSI
jgi:predicted amidophosphoribosyltransferase